MEKEGSPGEGEGLWGGREGGLWGGGEGGLWRGGGKGVVERGGEEGSGQSNLALNTKTLILVLGPKSWFWPNLVSAKVGHSRTIHVTQPNWNYRHDQNIVKVRDEIFTVCWFLRHEGPPPSPCRMECSTPSASSQLYVDGDPWNMRTSGGASPPQCVQPIQQQMDITVECGFNSHNH